MSQRIGSTLASLAVIGALSCASDAPPAETDAAIAHPTATADELLVVDCLLPGQVRKLGSRFDYLTPRRPVKSSAIECEIRGGEYVSFDRANYATALAVWLPFAEKGDPEAQNYVGEIFERGLGREPDYANAANWYRRAADQNFSAAQINLGQLYERGLGVERNVAEALNWYERAAGVDGQSWELVSAPELASLRDQLEVSTVEAEQLRSELAGARRDIERVRQQRDAREVAAAKALDAVAKERTLLAEERRRVKAEAERIEGASVALERRRTESEGRAVDREKVASRTAELDAREAELEAQFRTLAASTEELERRSHDLELKRGRLEQEQQDSSAKQVAASRAELAERERQLAVQTARLENEEHALARERGELEAVQLAQSALADYAVDLGKREQALQERTQRLEARAGELTVAEASAQQKREEIAKLDSEIERLRRDAEKERQQLTALTEKKSQPVSIAGPSIQMIDPLLVATRESPERRLREIPMTPGVPERVIVGRVEAPAGLLSLTINDLATEIGSNGLFQSKVGIESAGTKVEIVAVDRQGGRESLEFLLLPQEVKPLTKPVAPPRPLAVPADIDFGKYFALVIGNDDYQHLPDLTSAVNDADELSELLSTRYGFRVTKLHNATRYQILSALNELTAKLTKSDNLLVYYAGHGELDRVNQVGHWLPVDAEPNNSANWLSTRSLTDELNRIKARHVLVVADSCYSGALTRAVVTRLKTGELSEERAGWIKAQLGLRVRMALTSGGLKPVLDVGDGKHSLFARSLLDVLRSNQGVLDGLSLYQAISARVVKAARELDFEQMPEYAPILHGHHENGHFLFVPRA